MPLCPGVQFSVRHIAQNRILLYEDRFLPLTLIRRCKISAISHLVRFKMLAAGESVDFMSSHKNKLIMNL